MSLRFVVLALALVQVAQGQNFCVLPAKIQQGVASMAGTLSAPVPANVRPNAKSFFSGIIGIVFPQGECILMT
jgi:hypothetical protein